MNTLGIIKELCKKNGTSLKSLERELGYSNGSLAKANVIPSDRILEISKYFDVSMEYLMTGKEVSDKKESPLSPRDQRDIAKDVDRIMEKLSLGEDGPASYNGEILSPESMELFKEELQIALKRLKLINKERYNPHKSKK